MNRQNAGIAAIVLAFSCLSTTADPATIRPASSGLLDITIHPAATGPQLVRVSLPFAKGWLKAEQDVMVSGSRQAKVLASVRPLTWHPRIGDEPKSVRRGMVSFTYVFADLRPVELTVEPVNANANDAGALPIQIKWEGSKLKLQYSNAPAIQASLVAPNRTTTDPPKVETVENSRHFIWRRFTFADPTWPRVVEVRADAMGTIVLSAHLQRYIEGNGRAPDFGWVINSSNVGSANLRTESGNVHVKTLPVQHEFKQGRDCTLLFADDKYQIYQPSAIYRRSGNVKTHLETNGDLVYEYLRCQASELVPMQQAAWHRAQVTISLASTTRLMPTLRYPHQVLLQPSAWNDLYQTGEPVVLGEQSPLRELLDYHREAILRSVAIGHDWGNITFYNHDRPVGDVNGMNRLNHCPPIFFEGYLGGDTRLVDAAIAWCDNFNDQTIWWGPEKTGGTRYPNTKLRKGDPLEKDPTFMWRSHTGVSFCTKGYDSFFIAYEETGDPIMLEALDAQIAYAAEHISANKGECRNIGDVRDFIRLYEYTGRQKYLDEALRLFRELRTKLSLGDLFDQGGKPIDPDPPFIEEDNAGLKQGFAKPYIIGYALNGLPELARYAPDEPKLRDVIQAVADFLARSQDPLGGWRYPHPASSKINLASAIENAWHIVQADKLLGPRDEHLDAIERVLRQRLYGWLKTGKILSGVTGWEYATGLAKTSADIYSLYKKPADRDAGRDYTQGTPSLGTLSPEGIVYFHEVLAYYLKHRPESRLLNAPQDDDPLGKVLARLPNVRQYQQYGVRKNLPAFRDSLAKRMTYPMSWLSGKYGEYDKWRKTAREKVMACLLAPPPPAASEPFVLAKQDRGTYVAKKIVFNVSADSRVLGLMVVPKGKGPFPAVLLLHDHGAKFDIGKEKMIETWDDPTDRPKSARQWVDKYYGGRFIGDELAKRGYVCFCTDALNWSDRGGGGYEGQQALNSNLLNMGMSLAGCIAHEDMRAAEFLAARPEVDAKLIAAMGLSMGCFRTWQVAALSDRIAVGVAICWMATHKGLMVEGNNQTGGQSAYTMTHPDLANYLDYPDVAGLACPKPMLFYSGLQDKLFPVPCVEQAYAKMHAIWKSQNAGDRLVTKLWDVPHVFNAQMQDEAFNWLDKQMKPSR